MSKSIKVQGKHTYQNEDVAYWQNHIKQAAQSKLSRAAYCRQHEVDYDRFYYWYKKLSKRQDNNLLPIEVISTAEPDIRCTLELANGMRLIIYSRESLAYILKIV